MGDPVVAWCGVCAASLPAGAATCPRCGSAVLRGRREPLAVLEGARRAPTASVVVGLVKSLGPLSATHFAVVVGLLAAVVVAAVRRLGTAVDGRGDRLGMPALLLGGALAVGLLAELADLLGADPLDVLFSGQASIPAVIGEDSTKIIIVLLVAKFLAYGVSLGCGFRGVRDLPE